MFRIDRRFVKLSGTRVSKANTVNAARKTGAAGDGGNPEGDKPIPETDSAAFTEDTGVSAGEAAAAAAAGLEDGAAAGGADDNGAAGDAAGTGITEEDAEAAAAAAEKAAEKAEAAAEEMAKQYMSAAEREIDERAQKILKDTNDKAAKILEDAQAEALEIIETAKAEADSVHKEAYDKGFAEGKAEGESEGRRICDEKLEQQRTEDEQSLRSVLGEIAREREREFAEREEVATALAVEIVRKIFNPAEEELGNVFISLIKNAFRQMSSDGKFVIRVAPGEYERYFSSGAAAIELDSGVTVTATVLRDVSLEEGDLIIDTEDVTINAGMNSQLEYVKLAFEGANQYEPSPAAAGGG